MKKAKINFFMLRSSKLKKELLKEQRKNGFVEVEKARGHDIFKNQYQNSKGSIIFKEFIRGFLDD